MPDNRGFLCISHFSIIVAGAQLRAGIQFAVPPDRGRVDSGSFIGQGIRVALSDEMKQELDRRIEVAEGERAEDPSFVELPRADRLWLVALVILSFIGVAVQQAL